MVFPIGIPYWYSLSLLPIGITLVAKICVEYWRSNSYWRRKEVWRHMGAYGILPDPYAWIILGTKYMRTYIHTYIHTHVHI